MKKERNGRLKNEMEKKDLGKRKEREQKEGYGRGKREQNKIEGKGVEMKGRGRKIKEIKEREQIGVME